MPKRRIELGLAQAALVFDALGDETRLRLLQQLSQAGPSSITELAEDFQVSRQAVTKHLQFLAMAGMIDGKRAGREHLWTLNAARVAEAQRCLDAITRGWDDALGRLKAHVEEE